MTTDPKLMSWVDAANAPDAEFPVQALPWTAFRRRGSSESPRLGIPIGDMMLELRKCVEAGLLRGIDTDLGEALCAQNLNRLLAMPPEAWRVAREAISHVLRHDTTTLRDSNRWRKRAILPFSMCELLMPVSVGDYTDFYASLHHATNVGSMFRPDNPLLPNWKHLPIGYHGRASSIVLSGTRVARPHGQTCPKEGDPPVFGPVKSLDYELEVGCVIGGENPIGTRVDIADAQHRLFGLVLVNDWSARDVQKWEYQPLGPFNAKNFATSIGPYVMQMEALEPFRTAPPKRAKGDPKPLPYLMSADDFAIDLKVEVLIESATMREKEIEPMSVSVGSMKDLYWTLSQMVAHHTSTGCNLRPGDLIATGTISGKEEESRGCLLERTWRGEQPLTLPDGTKRTWLEDGDEVIIRGWCEKRGARRITLGECRGRIVPATN